MYKIKIYNNIKNEKLKYFWKEIYSKNSYCLQNSFEWISIWWRHFQRKSRKLFIVTVEKNDSIIGIGPFMIEKNIFLKQLKFIGSGLTDFHEVLTLPREEELILSSILNFILNNDYYDIINLEQISDNTRLYRILRKNRQFKKREMVKCPIANLNFSSWEEFGKELKRKFRKEWSRKLNKISRQGNLELTKHSNNSIKLKDIKNIFSLHLESYKDGKKYNKLIQESIKNFIFELILKIKEIRIYSLVSDGELVSYLIGFLQNKVFYTWNAAFNKKFHSYSPGMLLRGLVIRDLIKNRIKKVNFMRGDYYFKNVWMVNDEKLTNYQFLYQMNPLKGYIGVKYYLAWKWLVKRKFKRILEKPLVKKILIKVKY